MSADAAREARLAEIVGAVVRQALADRGCHRVALLDDGSPEAVLAGAWLRAGVGEERVVPVEPDDRRVESVLQMVQAGPGEDRARHAEEARRMLARLVPEALVANPANKTALLLGGSLPPDPLFPLGDLYAGEVEELTGGWSAPAAVRALAARCGRVGRLDEALRARIDRRDPRGLETLPQPLRDEVEAALRRGTASRIHARVVPKIGTRTVGLDLFE